ncbi:hypothetical protein [Devosia aurantiaca]|nr:hypothetical protein [Devosia aurantiaca]
MSSETGAKLVPNGLTPSRTLPSASSAAAAPWRSPLPSRFSR